MLVIHRTGLMRSGDAIVLVAAASRHRRDAFAAAECVLDHLKSDSWFWKSELTAGRWRWVEPREQDYEDIRRWA